MQHAGDFEQMIGGEFLPRFAAHGFDELSGDHVKHVVVRIRAAETCRGFQKAKTLNRFGAAQTRARHEHQIALA